MDSQRYTVAMGNTPTARSRQRARSGNDETNERTDDSRIGAHKWSRILFYLRLCSCSSSSTSTRDSHCQPGAAPGSGAATFAPGNDLVAAVVARNDEGVSAPRDPNLEPAPILAAEFVGPDPVLVASESPLLCHLIREALPCSSVLNGAGTRNCQCIVQCASEIPSRAFYRCPNTGQTALHEAARHAPCIHVVRALTTIQPSLTCWSNYAGELPLHLLFRGAARHRLETATMLEVLEELLLPEPLATASVPTTVQGDLPLHTACRAPEAMVPSRAVERLLEIHPAAAAYRNEEGQTPLHLHCQRRNASVHIAKCLLSAATPTEEPFRCTPDVESRNELHNATLLRNIELIELIVATDPLSACDRTLLDGRTALHLLCLQHPEGSCLSAVTALLEAAPAIASRPDSILRSTPLHLLLSNLRYFNRRNNVDMGIVQAIVRAAPDCLKLADENNFLPLHHASQSGVDAAIVAYLLEEYPQAAHAETDKHDTALSLACTTNGSKESVRLLLEANVDATNVANIYGFLPIHCVARAHQPLVSIVRLLVKANAGSIDCLTNANELPIHLASSGACRDVLAMLMTDIGDSDIVSRPKTNKNTPLHYACQRNASTDRIVALAESNPSWLLDSNVAGFSPMQILCKKGQLDLRIISVFDRLGGCQVFSRADSFGHTPLHSAMRQETSMEAIRALIQAYPEGLHTRTMYGDTPLSLACMRHLSPPIVCEVACASFCARDLQNVDPHRLSPLFLRNRAGQSPMSIVMEEFRQANISSSKKSCSFTSAATPDLIHAFDILASLVKILHYGPNRSSNFHENLVIACLALHRHEVRLDPAFILRAILKNPAEATTFDQDQNYPLHVEASIPVEKMILLDSQCQWCGDACHKRLQVLHTLMDIYPNAAKHRNKDGAFPLGIMINNGRLWDKAFALTVRACPEAIHEVDNIPRGMVPHVLYQISNGCGADTLYMLIRSRLEILY